MKFRAHETFFIRKGWLYKGLKNVTQDPCVFVSKERNPIDVLGLGSNMVKSLRYWMKATGLTEESSARGRTSSQTLTSLAQIIYKEDRYFEELISLRTNIEKNIYENEDVKILGRGLNRLIRDKDGFSIQIGLLNL